LHPRKRVLDFVAAARILLSQGRDIKFRIIGPDDGDEKLAREAVQRYAIDDKVEFCGPLPHNQVLQEFAEARVYVLPSIDEPFSISVLEALMVGTPVVVTKRFHNISLLKKYNAVEISDPEPGSIANAIEKLLKNRSLSIQRSMAGQKLVKQELTIERVVDRLEGYYLGESESRP